ncbi:MAG: ATP-binding protein [Akkermansia sp.]
MDPLAPSCKTPLNLEYMMTREENIFFDRKSSRVKPANLAEDIVAFANAEGGTLAIGLADDGTPEGISGLSEEQINDLAEAPLKVCKPMPMFGHQFFPVTNREGKPDRILVLYIQSHPNGIIRTAKDEVYLRIGDRSVLMRGDNLRQLEYRKQVTRFENELCPHATVADLDASLIVEYKRCIGASNLPTEQVLQSRGMMRDGKLTYAAVLLFAENVRQFYPNCRVRFIRYAGNQAFTGLRMNITKDFSIDEPILRLIGSAKSRIGDQLRDFTALNLISGKFETMSEYPEFSWQEGIINAVTHREYGLGGDYIRVLMFDDHLVIESPGRLPYPVTVENIRNTRSSRNPTIARVLTDMGWVRELNEGVRRIYADMEEHYLGDPVFREDYNTGTFRLMLYNSAEIRQEYVQKAVQRMSGIDSWSELDRMEQEIVRYLSNVIKLRLSDIVARCKVSSKTIQKKLSRLIELGIVLGCGKPRSPQRFYCLKLFSSLEPLAAELKQIAEEQDGVPSKGEESTK